MSRDWEYGDCGMDVVPQEWQHGGMALPVRFGPADAAGELVPWDGPAGSWCER